MTTEPTEEKLPLIGRDRFIVDKFAKELWMTGRSLGDYSQLRERPRGGSFEIQLDTGHVITVTVELDRLEQGRPS